MTETRADVFCLTDRDGRLFNPAVQATVLAKYSRSPESARALVEKLSEEEADKFQEKWVVQFGHNSVAELAVVPVCFEGISIVASKFVESWQRPGYSEKSTRYQVFSRDSFVTPPGAPPTMRQFASRFYDAYDRLHPKMIRRCAELMGEDPNAKKPKKEVKARAFDNIRYLLPAGTGTNVAAVVNMRDARKMIVGLRGHSNSEFRLLGDKLHDAAMELAPSLVKHTEPDRFRLPIKGLGALIPGFDPSSPAPYVQMSVPHPNVEPAYEQAAFESRVIDLHGMSWTTFCKHMEGRPDHAEVPEVFKTIPISFDVMMDYGAFRDLQRHRRCEQYVEPLTSNYGYVVPDDIAGSDLEPEYREAMESLMAYDDDQVVHDVDLMQYMIPLGYLHRSRFQMDLKELYYIVELRTSPRGHISYRRIAYEMFSQAKTRYPELLQWCRVTEPTTIGLHS
jgi:thymidylate synthase ThyX